MIIHRFDHDNSEMARPYIGLKVCRFGNDPKWYLNGPYKCPLAALDDIKNNTKEEEYAPFIQNGRKFRFLLIDDGR
jgi:hypothetical protein